MSAKPFTIPIAALVLIAAVPVPSAAMAGNEDQANSSSSASGESAGTPKAQRKICKTFRNSASRMRAERLCLTRAQWREFDAAMEH